MSLDQVDRALPRSGMEPRSAGPMHELDLVSYVWHRTNHRLAILWRFHQVHYADEAFTVSTAVRFHPGEPLLSLPIRLGAAVLRPLAGCAGLRRGDARPAPPAAAPALPFSRGRARMPAREGPRA